MDQIEEFDSTSSSSSSSSSESSSNESSGEDDGESSCEAGESDVNDSQEEESGARETMAAGLPKTAGLTGMPVSSKRSYRQRDMEEEEEDGGTTIKEGQGGRRRKRLRKRKAAGLRKKLRTHIDSVDEFNPEARSAQSAELERLRRLQLQQSIVGIEPAAPLQQQQQLIQPQGYSGFAQPAPGLNVPAQHVIVSPLREGTGVGGALIVQPPGASTTPIDTTCTTRLTSRSKSSSPEVLMVDLTYAAKMGDRPSKVEDAIVIDSGSDSDNEQGRTQLVVAKTQSGASGSAVVGATVQSDPGTVAMPTRSELLKMKYGDIQLSSDGRVLVNEGHEPSEEDVFLAPQISRTVKPHQVGGIRFLYDNIVESLSRFHSSPGFGCILAHSMGLGKTLQVIAFIDVFLRCTPAKHVLCVVPVNTLQNWISEFDHWVPPSPASVQSGQSSGAALLTNQNPLWGQVTSGTPPSSAAPAANNQQRGDEVHYRTFNISVLSEANRTMESRLKVISEWRSTGGVLLLGYEMYRLLSLSVPSLGGNKMAVKKKKNLVVKAPAGGTIDLDETEREMDALIDIQKALCKPGPDLVVCDEGHRIKNDYSNISQALKRIRTRRRIVMTGYPLQNNLTEYWCMVDFVRPNLLGTKQEFADLFERPITNGQCMDSTPMACPGVIPHIICSCTEDVQLMRYRSHVLHSLLEGFVLRRGHEILKTTLPRKFEHVLYLRPSQVQADLYNYSMSSIDQAGGPSATAGPLKAFAVCSKIWNHPDIYYQEALSQSTKRISPTAWLDQEGLPKTLLSGGKSAANESSCKVDWPSSVIPNYQPGLLENSPKMLILIELIDRSIQLGDKILIFSQSLSTLSYIEKLLSQRPIPIPNSNDSTGSIQYSNVKWVKNKNYCRLDGSTNSVERDRLINNFNSDSNHDCWVFLLSTKAGCLGINLIGANRVIVTDVSWNPCYDSQAVCRVYRYGQTKPCYIYRLVCDGTMERKIYDRQISKQSMSNRVVDELHPERHLTSQDILKLITPLAPLPPPSDLSHHALEFLFDPLLMEICSRYGHLLTKVPFKHESLLIDSEEERMTDIEKYLAMKGFQQQLKALRSNPGNQSGSIQGYRPQPGPSNTPRPPQQTGQARSPIATGQSRTITSQTGQARLQQVRPYPQIAGLQVPIPPVPEATPTSSGGLIQRGNVAAAPVVKKNIEVICLDSDEDDGSVSLTRGEPSRVGAAVAGDTVLLLQSPTQVLKSPLLQSVDPLPVSVNMPSVDPLPTSTNLLDTAPTSSSTTTTTTSDSSSALNLNMSHNNSISPLFHLLMAANQQRELFFAANCLTQEASLATYPQTTVATSSSNSVMFNGSHVVQQTGASDVQAAAMYSNLQSLTQAQEVSLNLEEQGAVAKSLCDTLLPFSSSVSFKNSLPLFQQHTQVFGTATPHISLSSPNTMMSSAMTSSPVSSQSPLLQLTSQTLPGPEFPDHQNDLNHHHSPSSLLSCSPPSNTLQINNKSPSISPVVQSSPSQFTPSPSSSSLSPPSPHHQAPPAHTPTTTMPQSSVMTLLTPNVLTSTQSPSSLKLKRSKSHSVPVCHLEVSPAKPLRKTQSSSAPKSYSLEQRCGSSSPNDDSQGTGARSSSVSPISTLSPSQSNSSDCSSSPERQSKPHNQSPQTRMESSVTFRYSSSPSPSNTPSAPYTPCSIPLLSPVAARLLFLSTGTKMPSSPPEDVDKLPPIINKRLVSSSCSTETQKKATSPLLKRECSDSNTSEKKHPVEKKKKKGSSLAKSMELVPTSNDSSVDSFFAMNTMAASCATTPTPTPTTVTPPMLLSPLQQVKAFVTTPSPSSPTPMLCSPLPLSRKSLDSVKPSVVSASDNLWAPKSHSGQPSQMSHDQSRVHQPEPLLSNMTLSSDSSLSNSITSSSSRMMSSSKSLSLRSDCLLTVTGSITCSSSSAPVPSSSHSKSSLPVWSDMSKMCSSVHSTPSISSAAVSPAVKKKVASPNLRDVLLHQFPQSGSPTVAHNTASRESVSPCISGASLPPVTTKSLYNSPSISGTSPPPGTTNNSHSLCGANLPTVSKSLYNSAFISGTSLPPVTTKSLYNSPSISGVIPPPGTTNNSHSLCGANLPTVSKSLYNSHSFSSVPVITKSMYTSPLPAQGAPQESAQHLQIPSGVSLPTFVQIQKTATKVTAVTTNQLADKAKSSHTPNCAAVARSTKVVTATSTIQNSVRNSVAVTHQLAAYSTSFTHCTSTVPTAAHFSSPTHYNNSVVSTAVTAKSTSPTHFMSSASANSCYVSPAQLTASIPATVHSTSPTYLVSSVPATSQYTSPNQFASSLPTAVHSTSPTHFITSASPVQLTTSSPAAKHPTSSGHFKNSAAVSLHATNITNSMPVTAAQSTSPTPSASSASVPLSAEMSSDSATNLSLIMPEGFEQHVVSGLLQAGPPMTLNKMQSSGGADTQKKTSQAPVMSSSGTSPVTAGSNHPRVSAVSSTQRSRKRSSSDSNTLLSPPPVSCSKLMNKSSLPSRTPFAMKPPSSLTSPPAVSSSPFSLQANSVLPSPTTTAAAATSAKPHPLLLSNGNDSTSCLSSLASCTIQEGVTAVSGLNVNGNVSNTSNLEYGDSLITSPSELLSPPGSTSLPELLKSFTFSVSFSPPLERRQPLTTSPGHQKNVEAALQQRYVPVQSSLKSPDCQRNGSVSQQINGSGISPNHHRELVQSSLKSPDYQRNGGLSQRRSSIEISPNRHHQPVQSSLKSPDCQGNGFNIQPNQQRNGEGVFPNHQQRRSVTVPVGQRNNRAATAILTADHQKSASAISHDKQRRNPAPSSKQSRNSPATVPNPERNSKDMPHNLNRSSCLASPNHSRGNNRPHSINNKNNPLPSPTANKGGNLLSPSCLGSGSVRSFDHLGINGDNSQRSRGQLQSIHQGNSSLFSLNDQQGGIIPTSNHQKSSPAMLPISWSTSVSSATTLNNKAILSLRGHGSGTILSPSGHGNGTILSPSGHGNSTLLSLSGLANDMVSLNDHSNSTISPIGISNGTVPHSSLGNIKVSPGGRGNGNMLSPSGLSNGNMLSAGGLGNGTLPSHCSHGNGTTLSPSNLSNITMLSPSCLGNSTMVSPTDSGIGKSTGVSPNGVSNSTMPLPSGIENSAAAPSVGQRITSVISNSCCRNTPPLSYDQKVTRTTLATEQMRCNPVISPSPYSSLLMPSSGLQGSYTVPLSSSPASCTVLPSSGIGSSPVKVTSGCQKNVSVIAHSSDRSVPKLSHDLRKTSTLPLVSSHDYQGWPILSSSNQLATGTAVSRNDQSGFCRPQSGHQGRSQIISPISQRRDLPSPMTQRCDLPSPTSQRRDLPSPTSQRRDLPSPMTQRRDLPSPMTQRRDLPSPMSQRRDLPSPMSQRRDLPSPTTQRRDLPSPTSQRRDLPSPDRQRNSGHSSFKHPRNSPVSVLNSQRNIQNPQPPDCRQNVRLSSPGYSRNSSVPLSNHNFVISQRSDCNLLSSERNSSPILTPDRYRNSTSTVFATTCQQSNAVFSSSCHGSSCVPTTQSDHKSSSVMMPGDYHGSSAVLSPVLSPNLPRRDAVISPKAKPHSHVQPSTDRRSNNLSQSGSKHQQRDSPLLSPQLPSYQSATAAAARQQGTTSAAARTPQQQTSTGRSSPAASVAVASNTSSTVLHPLQIPSSSTLQSKNVVPQNTSLPSVSPSWDSATLSFLSDLFSPEPPAKQRHHSDSSLSKYPQNSVTPPCVGGDRVVAEVQENAQSHGSQTLCKYPQTSATLSNSSGQDIINDLLASFQIPSDPQDSIKKSPASFSTASVQRTPPTVPHPLIHQQQVSSSCMKSSLPRQQPDQTLGSQLSSPLLHQTAAQASSLINDVRLTQQNFATVHENQQLGRSSLPPAYSRPHVQLPSQQGATAPSPASLPKLVPFTRQTLQQNSSHPGCGQSLSSVPTPHSQSPITSTQLDASKFGGHISSATSFTPQVSKSAESAVVNFPAAHMPPSSDVQTNDLDSMSTAETAGSLNLLSILNSLTPSQLESLLNAGEKQPVSDGNDCQEYLHTTSSTSNSDTQPVASTSSLMAMDQFQHSNFVTPSSANHLPSRPLSSCSRGAALTAAANFTQESPVLPLPPHPQRSKVINSNTSPQTSHAQFRVRSSCSGATAGVMGQLLQLESTAATAPCSGAMNSSSDTYVVFGNSPSVVRLHSAGQ